MANKKLTRLGLDDGVLLVLEKHRILTAGDLLSKMPIDLLSILDLPYPQIKSLLNYVSSKIIPPSVSVFEKWKETNEIEESEHKNCALPTTLPSLNRVLRGGIPINSITEIVGPAGIGKSQFCHMLSVISALPFELGGLNGGVVYFDTEKAFSPDRLIEIAQTMHPDYFSDVENLVRMSRQVTVFQISNSIELLKHLSTLEETIVEKNIKVIVIDSIANLVRKEYDSSIYGRDDILAKEAGVLKYMAESFKISVVVTNQVKTVFSQNNFAFQSSVKKHSHVTAALGTFWEHSLNTRIVLEYYTPNTEKVDVEMSDHSNIYKSIDSQIGSMSGVRKMTVAKSPIAPVVSLYYQIGSEGFQEVGTGYFVNKGNYWSHKIASSTL